MISLVTILSLKLILVIKRKLPKEMIFIFLLSFTRSTKCSFKFFNWEEFASKSCTSVVGKRKNFIMELNLATLDPKWGVEKNTIPLVLFTNSLSCSVSACNIICLTTRPPKLWPTNITGRWPTPHFRNLSRNSLLRSFKLVLKLSCGQLLPH